MLTVRRSQSKCCYFVSTVRRLMCQNSTNLQPLLDGKKKKKFSELTPQEIEAEVKENLIRLRKSFENDEKENYVVPIFKKSILYGDQPAIRDSKGEYTYIQLYVSAKRLAMQISNICGSAAMKNIGYLCGNNVLTSLTQWGCWISGQVAMPLNMYNSAEMLKALLQDSKASALIVTPENEELGCNLTNALDIPLMIIDHSFMVSSNTTLLSVPRILISSLGTVIVEGTFSNDFYTKANAMLLYTMGTTGMPKGVMVTHKNLDAQVKSLVNAWKYDSNDCLMHALPLNHAHGFINAFMCPLSVGGRIIMHDQFNSKNVWSSILGINTPVKERMNFFMAVPAVYNSLIAEYNKSLSKNVKMVDYIVNYCKDNVRLMVSGGSPLPPTIFRRWREITGHNILECYGTTEFGLVLSNPYNENEKSKRQAGFVGLPLPDVHVRLVGANNKVLVNCIGQYANETWSCRFLETNEKKKTQHQTDQLSSSSIGLDELAVKSDKLDKKEIISSLSEIFTNSGKKLTDNFYYALATASELLKSFQQTSLKTKTESTDFTKLEAETANETATNTETEEEKERVEAHKFTTGGLFATDVDAEKEANKQRTDITTQHSIHNIFDIINSRNILGELEVSGPQIFKGYYDNEAATSNAFSDNFFKTGDMAIFQDGVFKILGRTNIDVIEIAGKKISSYDIESLILEHPNIRDVTVVVVPEEIDERLEKQCANFSKHTKTLGVVCVLHQEAQLDLKSLNIFCSKTLPKCLLPTKLKIVDELPRSNMAEINRKALQKLFLDAEIEANKNTQ